MRTRDELLSEIQGSLQAGIITENDLRYFIPPAPVEPQSLVTPQVPTPPTPQSVPTPKTNRLSAIDIMFYVAGIILYATVLSLILQVGGGSSGALIQIFITAGIGSGLWVVAYQLIKSSEKTDINQGIANALLLTGSLSIITGGYIISNEIVGGYGTLNFVSGAIALALIGSLHIWFDRLIKRNGILLIGILLTVFSIPSLAFGLLQEIEAPADVWTFVFVLSAGLLAYATRLTAKILPDRTSIRTSFDSFATFVALLAMYITSFGEYGILWLTLLVGAIIGIFYLSIVAQNKHLLGNGSFFLVIAVVTIAFRYFSGIGITGSLVVSTIGILGTAAIATNINKKYFKQPPSTIPAQPNVP